MMQDYVQAGREILGIMAVASAAGYLAGNAASFAGTRAGLHDGNQPEAYRTHLSTSRGILRLLNPGVRLAVWVHEHYETK